MVCLEAGWVFGVGILQHGKVLHKQMLPAAAAMAIAS